MEAEACTSHAINTEEEKLHVHLILENIKFELFVKYFFIYSIVAVMKQNHRFRLIAELAYLLKEC
jgi:hypothetical protein